MERVPRQQYTREFRKQAVQLVLEQKIGGFKFHAQRMNEGVGAQRPLAASNSRDLSAGGC